MTAGLIGPVAVLAAMSLAVVAVVTGRRWALAWSAAAASTATVVLAISLLAGDFSLVYVARTTSLATPWPYRIAAVWGGMDGSMLFYSTLTLIVAWAGLKAANAVRVAAVVGLGQLSITMLFANPFVVGQLPPVDGDGLLAILQHPAMVYHPPILYLGLVTLVVPFAASLAAGSNQVDVRPTVKRWLYLSWILLTFGMAAGANWAYVELGWGGYWAWDPVENTALMPWLATTVFLHTSRVEDSSGRLRRWNVLFAGLPFALSVMGVYLTRSGSTGSIHSFAEDPVVGRVLLIAAVIALMVITVTSLRSPRGEPWGRIRVDRDAYLVANAMLLSAALVFIVAGSAYPAFRSVFGGAQVLVDSRFFVLTVLPISVLVAVGVAFALRVHWVAYLIALGAAATAILAIAGARPALFLIAPALASLTLLAHQLVTRRARGRRLAAQLAHIGVSLFLVGVAGSAFGEDFEGTMTTGESVVVAGHEVGLDELVTGEADRYVYVRAVFSVDGRLLEPEIRAYEDQTLPVAEPALRSTPRDDVIVAVSLLFPDRSTVAVSVFVRPLVWWVWVGSAVMGLAGLVALVSTISDGAARRRPATAGLRQGETTSGTSSR